MKKGRAYVIIDGQWGSTGKGKLAGYLADRLTPAAVACDFMTNAGHTWVCGQKKHVTQQIPTGAIMTGGPVILGPGSAITVSQLLKELEELQSYGIAERLIIHPHAAIIEDRHKVMEEITTERIASTMKGCGAALAEKVLRSPMLKLAKDMETLKLWVQDPLPLIEKILEKGGNIQVEGAQGFGLSLDYGTYPYVTSRNVTPGDIMIRSGIPLHHMGNVWGCLRTYPIRVGNIIDGGSVRGFSGPYWPDQEEVTWDYIERCSGGKNLLEKTTVTGRTRRVFTFSSLQLEYFVRVCNPDFIFLNFVNHIDASITNNKSKLPLTVQAFLRSIQERSGQASIILLGTGPDHHDMIDLGGW